MKQNTKTTKHSIHPVACADCTDSAVVAQEVKATNDDLKNAVLVISIIVNLFVLTAWITIETSSTYAAQLAQLIAG